MATRSVSFVGWSAISHFFMPSDSNWKIPVVSPRPNSLYVSWSSSGILSGSRQPSGPRRNSGTRGLLGPRIATHSFSTVSVLSPRKSILSSPTGSTKCPSYCVVKSDSPSVGITGSVSISGSREMMTPQAWTPGWRIPPSSFFARSMRRCTVGSGDSNASTSCAE